jgi:hypothetical protein
MPANTWTPTALASESHPWEGNGWRAVEAQHKNATMALVHGNSNDQKLLEDILEESKPVLPENAKRLHWLLSTPFRYWPPQPAGSRFRRRTDPGVFYGAEDRKTSCAECGYWRLQVWLDSEGLSKHPTSVPVTLFEFRAATERSIDLTQPPLVSDHARWTSPTDYSATQAVAESARSAAVELFRYASVRNPGGRCLALLSPEPFRNVAHPYNETLQQAWSLFIQPPDLTVWQRGLDGESFSFRY